MLPRPSGFLPFRLGLFDPEPDREMVGIPVLVDGMTYPAERYGTGVGCVRIDHAAEPDDSTIAIYGSMSLPAECDVAPARSI
jgi:hypothetical protein